MPRKPPPLDLSQALGHEAADKRIDILRRLGEAGSISEAARGAGVSYKAAWQAVETLGNLAGQPLVEKVVGGSGGGGARLTAAGQRLLEAAGQLAAARAMVLARLGQGAGADAAAGLAALGLRTSMRNQLPCTVQALETVGDMVRATLALPGGAALRSRITVESAQLLGLAPGLPVIALCKATAVSVGRALEPGEGVNLLAGRLRRVAAAHRRSEVSVQLEGGLALVGFAPEGLGLRAGQRVMAAVDEAAIVVAGGG